MAIHSVLSPFHCPDQAPRLLMLVPDSQWRTAGHLLENSSGTGDQPHLYHLDKSKLEWRTSYVLLVRSESAYS